MKYALVVDGQIMQDTLPNTGYLKDGSSVSQYYMLDDAILRSEGWLPIVDSPPVYDAETQTLTNGGYVVDGDRVIVDYKVEDIPFTEVAAEVVAE